jgi:plastocyanin
VDITNNRLRTFKLLALLSLALTACGMGAAGEGVQAPTELEISMTEFAFAPDEVSVPAGEEVTLNLENNGDVEHDWVLMERDYSAEPPFNEQDQAHVLREYKLPAGESQTYTFTAPNDPGEYQIVCSIDGHLESGMDGALTVTGSGGEPSSSEGGLY